MGQHCQLTRQVKAFSITTFPAHLGCGFMMEEAVGGEVKELARTLVVDTIKEWYTYITTYNDNINQLRDKYHHLDSQKQTLISNVDRKKEDLRRPTKLTDVWLHKVKSLMEEDEELKQLVDEESRIRKDQCCFGRFHCNLRKRYEMSKTAEMKAKNIEAVIQEAPHDESMITEPLSRSELNPIPTEFLKSLHSRVTLMEDVLKKLRHDRVDVVGIYGMGAIGKTTLVKEIANKDAKGIFHKIVMVEISEAPNTERIQDQIVEQLNMTNLGGMHNTYERANRLYNSLQTNGKILIILDNVWEKLDLSKVGIPQPHENTQEFCCKLLLTSRKKNVCEVMGALAGNIFEVHTLNEEEARQLFRARVGEKGQDDKIEKRMLNKCGGLPLSIVALADVLRDQELSMWEHYAVDLEKPISSHGTIRGVNQATYSILETSYKLMESEGKRRFFMLACLFPLGSNIPIDDMMRYGIGLGLFQHVDNLTEAMQQARTWVDELKSSSLLLAGDSYFFREDHVKIHDVVRASTISLAEKGGDVFMVESFPRWMHKETLQKYSGIILTAGIDHSRLSGLNSEKLNMLILKRSPPLLFDDTLSQSRIPNLKVLVLKEMGCNRLSPKSIESFKNSLTTLHLERCELGDIGCIGELVSLVVLSFRGSRMYELPESMRNLCDLRLLDLRECDIGTQGIPANVLASLSQLEGLYAYDAVKKWGRSVQESGAEEEAEHFEDDDAGKSSSNSSGGGGQSRYASIDELNRLNYLNVLEMAVELEELPTEGDQLLQNLDQFRVLVRGFQIYYPIWKGDLSRELVLYGLSLSRVMENSCGKALVQKSDCLKLYFMNGLEQYLGGRFEEFKGIKRLVIQHCNELRECNTCTSFPNLERLDLAESNEVRTIQPSRQVQQLGLLILPNLHPCVMPIHLVPPNLTQLDVAFCVSLKFMFGKAENETDDDDDPTPTHELPFLRILKLMALPELQSLVEVSRASNSPALFHEKLILEALEELHLDGCVGFATLWGVRYSKFHNLKIICIRRCDKLKSLGSLSIATALVQLEDLSILECGEISEGMSEDGESTDGAALMREDGESHDEAALLSKCRGRDNINNTDTLSLFPSLQFLDLQSCPKMEKFITASNQRCVVEFPSLHSLWICDCHEIQSFSAGPFRAPKLSYFQYDSEDQSMEDMGDINHFLHTRFQRRSSEQ